MRGHVLHIAFGLVMLLAPALAQTNAPPSSGPVYVVPVKDVIERALVHMVRRRINRANKEGAAAIILDMDTPGGRLDATREIISIITDTDAPTYTYVNPRAISAGAITAMATDAIYMAPGASIGDAMPIMLSMFGSPQEVPDSMREKIMSPTVALIRSTAEMKGHNPDLAEAMVRPEYEYRVGDDVICPTGQLLTLTSEQAAATYGEDSQPLLSQGTVKDLDTLIETLGLGDSEVVVMDQSPVESLGRFIEGFPISGLLLAAGLLLVYLEIKTPGFGIPGALGLLLLVIWFWGHHIAGLAGAPELILFVIGLILILVELFVIPGFGIVGVSGITCIVVSLIMAMVQHYPGTPVYDIPELDMRRAVLNLSAAICLAAVFMLLLARFLPHTSVYGAFVLQAAQAQERGYTASRETADLVGRPGKACTPLHPAGIALIDGKRVDVVARGAFIGKDDPVVVAETHGSRIVVEPAREAPPPAAGHSGDTA